MQQSGEPRTPTASCRLSYAVERGSHVIDPARSPGHARRDGISLGLPPSLHHLRRRRGLPRSLVRQLLRYYAAVRLPAPVAHRRTPLGFTMRSAPSASQRGAEGRGISRFPSEMFPRVRGVCDRAGSGACLANAAAPVWPSAYLQQPRHPGLPAALAAGHGLRGSIPGPRVPLSTLRPHPHERARMTRGRRSWLSLQRMTLSFTTSRRF